MGYPADHKSRTRQRIIAQATTLFKERGYNGVNIDQIMQTCDLTRGGFYAHFKSKNELFTEAMRPLVITGVTDGSEVSEDQLGRILDHYLSPAHRDHPGSGCPLPALAADVPASTPAARNQYQQTVKGLTGLIATGLKRYSYTNAKDRALAVLGLMVGGIVIARALGRGKLSNSVLSACHAAARLIAGLTKKPGVWPS